MKTKIKLMTAILLVSAMATSFRSVTDAIFEADEEYQCQICTYKLKEIEETLSAREKFEMKPRGGGDSIYMCKSCMKKGVSEAIKDGPLSFPPAKFPLKHDEYGEITMRDIDNHASIEAIRRFCVKQLDAEDFRTVHFCDHMIDPQNHCNNKIPIPANDWERKERQCDKCGEKKLLSVASRFSDEQHLEIINGLARPCPHCHRIVQKGQACNDIHCNPINGGCDGHFHWTGKTWTGLRNPENFNGRNGRNGEELIQRISTPSSGNRLQEREQNELKVLKILRECHAKSLGGYHRAEIQYNLNKPPLRKELETCLAENALGEDTLDATFPGQRAEEEKREKEKMMPKKVQEMLKLKKLKEANEQEQGCFIMCLIL